MLVMSFMFNDIDVEVGYILMALYVICINLGRGLYISEFYVTCIDLSPLFIYQNFISDKHRCVVWVIHFRILCVTIKDVWFGSHISEFVNVGTDVWFGSHICECWYRRGG